MNTNVMDTNVMDTLSTISNTIITNNDLTHARGMGMFIGAVIMGILGIASIFWMYMAAKRDEHIIKSDFVQWAYNILKISKNYIEILGLSKEEIESDIRLLKSLSGMMDKISKCSDPNVIKSIAETEFPGLIQDIQKNIELSEKMTESLNNTIERETSWLQSQHIYVTSKDPKDSDHSNSKHDGKK